MGRTCLLTGQSTKISAAFLMEFIMRPLYIGYSEIAAGDPQGQEGAEEDVTFYLASEGSFAEVSSTDGKATLSCKVTVADGQGNSAFATIEGIGGSPNGKPGAGSTEGLLGAAQP